MAASPPTVSRWRACKVGYCYREKPDGDWDSGWRFTAGDESEEYMDDLPTMPGFTS